MKDYNTEKLALKQRYYSGDLTMSQYFKAKIALQKECGIITDIATQQEATRVSNPNDPIDINSIVL